MSDYDQIAEWYDQSVRTGSLSHDFVEPILFDLMSNVRGIRICDLACGQGTTARKLAQRGAIVVGVDLSAKLLKIAQDNEAPTFHSRGAIPQNPALLQPISIPFAFPCSHK